MTEEDPDLVRKKGETRSIYIYIYIYVFIYLLMNKLLY